MREITPRAWRNKEMRPAVLDLGAGKVLVVGTEFKELVPRHLPDGFKAVLVPREMIDALFSEQTKNG